MLSFPLTYDELVLILRFKQAVLHVVDRSERAKLSCEHARKHARDAELHLARVQLEVGRIQKLCERFI